MKDDFFVPVIFPEQIVGVPGLGSGSYGHAGCLQIDGDTGAYKYYEYGRYDNTRGVLKSVAMAQLDNTAITFDENGNPDIRNVVKVLGDSRNTASTHTGDVFASIFRVSDDKYQALES